MHRLRLRVSKLSGSLGEFFFGPSVFGVCHIEIFLNFLVGSGGATVQGVLQSMSIMDPDMT